jgi:hypothetical protein
LEKKPFDVLPRVAALLAVTCALSAGCSSSQDSVTDPAPGGGDTSGWCPAVIHNSGSTIRFPLTSSFDQMRSATIDMCMNGACGQVVFDFTAPPATGGLGKDGPRVTSASGGFDISATLWATLAGGFELEARWQSPIYETFRDGDVYTIKATASNSTTLFDLTQSADHYAQATDPEYPCLGRWQTFSITRGP